MKGFKNFFFVTGILFLISFVVCVTPTWSAGKTQIRIGTWGTTDASYFLAGGMARILNQKVPQVNAIVVPSGTARNMLGFEDGKINIGWTQSEALHFAPIEEAGGAFKKGEIYKKARVLLYLAPSLTHAVVLDSSKIKKITDINRKVRIAVHSPSSLMPARIPLRYHGVKDDEYNLTFLNKGPQCEALKDGNLDVSFQSGLYPIPAITKLAAERKIRFLYWDKERIKKAVKDSPQYTMGYVPKDLYGKGYPEKDYVSMGQLVAVGASADLDEELVYVIVKTLLENVDDIKAVHEQGKLFTAKNTGYWISQLEEQFPFHPGAKRYLKEQGVKFVE